MFRVIFPFCANICEVWLQLPKVRIHVNSPSGLNKMFAWNVENTGSVSSSHPLGKRDQSSLLHTIPWRFASLLECSHCALHGTIQGKWRTGVTCSNYGGVWKGGNTELNFKTGYKSVCLIPGNALPLLDIREMLPFFIILPLDVWLASKVNALAANRRKHSRKNKPPSLFVWTKSTLFFS